MAYLTNYILSVSGQKVSEYEALNKIVNHNPLYDSCSWYDHEDHMRELSEQEPDELFELRGYGENYEDIWVKYFKSGKMQYEVAKIIIEPFDEAKLQ